MKNALLRKLRPLMALSLIYPLTACETIQTPQTTDVSCEVFCDFQYDPVKSHPRDIVQSKMHNARRKAIGCAPKACVVDVDMLDEVKRSHHFVDVNSPRAERIEYYDSNKYTARERVLNSRGYDMSVMMVQ